MDLSQFFWDASVYMSLLGLVLFIIVFLSGLRIIKPKPKLKLHKRLGIAACCVLGFHAIVMLYFYFFT
jgi:cytochrome b subunit of formate dehydrogenase